MVTLCFVLDLRSLSPPLLAESKQLLLQLANLYAISRPLRQSNLNPVSDRIGLCYLMKNRNSSSDELKIGYRPTGNLSIRDFHHAVKNLPTDAFLPQVEDEGTISCYDVKLSSVLSDQVLYSWGCKESKKKVVILSSCLPEAKESAMKETLMEAAEKDVSVEFVLLEQKSSHLRDMQEHVNSFLDFISDVDNCLCQTYPPDAKVYQGLVRKWLQDLKDDLEEPLQARFVFKSELVDSVNQIICNLCASVNLLDDGFSPCETCRCHGMPLGNSTKNRVKGPYCPVSGHDLDVSGIVENSVKVGESTILLMPSFYNSLGFEMISSPVDFSVIERTPLGSLSEGVITGASFVVTPPTCQEMRTASDETEQPELNNQLFRGLCNALHSLDQGLVCSSFCNVETMRNAAFLCYYILQPSDNGPMLLRRLAGSEEVLLVPDVNQCISSLVPEEIEISILTCLGKMESREYNPVLHERGFHQKLNSLVKESLQFGFIPPRIVNATPELNSSQQNSSKLTAKSSPKAENFDLEEENQVIDPTGKENIAPSAIAEEWEQLVVSESPKRCSPTCITKTKQDIAMLSSPDTNKPKDEKTSKILERLEVPRQLKSKSVSPVTPSNNAVDSCMAMKKPLIPFQPSQAAEGTTSSQLMKPIFQRLKRKYK